MSWTTCKHCGSTDTNIIDRELIEGRCECGAEDPAHIYGDASEGYEPECECSPEDLKDQYEWLLSCNKCRNQFTAFTETDRY